MDISGPITLNHRDVPNYLGYSNTFCDAAVGTPFAREPLSVTRGVDGCRGSRGEDPRLRWGGDSNGPDHACGAPALTTRTTTG